MYVTMLCISCTICALTINDPLGDMTMLKKSDLATPEVIEGWLNDMALTSARKQDGANNWNLEFTVNGGTTLVINVVNPKTLPRAIMIVCGMMVVPGHQATFNTLSEAKRIEFWRDLRTLLSREFVEFQLEGMAVVEAPKTLRVSAVRFDDGLTLDSFARSLASVCKACGDVVPYFTERLGDPTAQTGGEFAFKKSATQ
jgi:hypothetical protein